MARELEQLRNIGIVAHIDAGKTTLTERMLFYCGATHKLGEVDKGTTETDFDPEEQQRGITIYSACVTFNWKDTVINLIDTPGHVDFTAEVERCLRVLDGAVVVFSAREGVEAQSETVWRQAQKYRVPRVAFINKMDREGADFYDVLEEISGRLGARPVAIQIPVGAGPPHQADPFRGVLDLVANTLLTFPAQQRGSEVVSQPVPPELAEDAAAWRSRLVYALCDYSDELMEKVLADEPASDELLSRVLRDATLHGYVQPVLCGSALNNMGVQPVLDAVARYLPSPADMPPVEGSVPDKADQRLRRKPHTSDPFCGLLFKVVADRHGDMFYVRVYSGTLRPSTRVLNAGRHKKENVAQLWHIHADSRQQIDEVSAGDIVGIIGLRHSITGDTLCHTQHPILLESIQFPETVISMAIEPESSTERKKLADTLELMKRQDPTFQARENEETGQTLISGMGELHLEVIKHRLLRDFSLDVKVHKPRVSYRETIAHAVRIAGECHRQISGESLQGRVRIEMCPLKDGPAVVRIDQTGSDTLPEEAARVAAEVLRELSQGSGLLGFPLMKVAIALQGGDVTESPAADVALRIAAADAFNRALAEAGVVLLEPIMRLEVSTPEEHLGDFMADLQQRRAIIHRTQSRGNVTHIEAEAPLASLFGYSSAMRSLSQGRATATMEPSSYGQAPPEVVERFR